MDNRFITTHLTHEFSDPGSRFIIVISITLRLKDFKELFHANNLRIITFLIIR